MVDPDRPAGARTSGAGRGPVESDDRVAQLPERLAEVRRRIAAAARAAQRDPATVRLLLATKTVALDVVRAAVLAGADLLGENRVQELVLKAPGLSDLDAELHVIGPLQSNKIAPALRWARCVQTVDSLRLAQRLADRCAATGRDLDVMVQVNVSGEPTKSGVPPQDAVALATGVAALEQLHLTGFMTIGARSDDRAVVRHGFRLLRQIRDDVVCSGRPGTDGAAGLSMGMSGDLEAAVAEGSTIVRVGAAVFGARGT